MLRIEMYDSESPMEDTDSILSLVQKQMESIGSPKTLEQIRHTIANCFESHSRAVLFVGYDSSNTPAGFAFGNICTGFESGGDYFWLNELYVDPACRRCGYASMLLAFIEKWLTGKGINCLACVTGEGNYAAQSMYQKKGYEISTIIWVGKSWQSRQGAQGNKI